MIVNILSIYASFLNGGQAMLCDTFCRKLLKENIVNGMFIHKLSFIPTDRQTYDDAMKLKQCFISHATVRPLGSVKPSMERACAKKCIDLTLKCFLDSFNYRSIYGCKSTFHWCR